MNNVPDLKNGEWVEAGMKDDKTKVDMSLLLNGFPRALESVGDVLTFGAKKYAPHNWLHVENGQERYQAAQMRHELSHCKGELVDEESGLLHLTHEAFCVLARLELKLREMENQE